MDESIFAIGWIELHAKTRVDISFVMQFQICKSIKPGAEQIQNVIFT